MLLRIIAILAFFSLCSGMAVAQVGAGDDICNYRKIREEGIQAMNRGNFPEATNLFWLALECPDLEPGHDINQLIREVQGRWVAALKTQVGRAEEAELQANKERAIAVQARQAEEEAKKEAQANAEKARRSGLLAESLRLSLLSEVTLARRGQKEDALLLAFLSLKLSERDTFASGMRAFAQSVRDSMEEKAFQPETPIDGFELLPGGKSLIAHAGSNMYIIDDQTGKVKKLPADGRLPHPGAVSDDGSLVLAFEEGGKAQLWNMAANQGASIAGHGESILAGDFAPGNQAAITGSRDNTAKVWSPQGQATATFTGHQANVYGVQCSADSKHFLTRSADGTARVWDTQGNCLAILTDEAGYIYDARFSPNGKQVVTAGASGRVKIWSLQGQSLAVCEGHTSPAKQILFAKDGQRILTRSEDAIKLWTEKGELLGALSHPGPITGLHLSPDGSLAVTWEEGPLVILWDTEGNRLQEFSGHRGVIRSAELSPDGRMLLTTATDGTAKLWDRNGHILIDWNLRSGQPAPALFSADGRYVFTAQDNNRALMACPTPYLVYEQMVAQEEALAPKVKELQKQYHIQFMD